MEKIFLALFLFALAGCGDGDDESSGPSACARELEACRVSLISCVEGK